MKGVQLLNLEKNALKHFSPLMTTLILFDFVGGCIKFGEIVFRSKIQRTG